MIALRFFKQFWMSFPPLFDSLHRRGMADVSLRNIGGFADMKIQNQSFFKLLGDSKRIC
jgi:hypothetical protein